MIYNDKASYNTLINKDLRFRVKSLGLGNLVHPLKPSLNHGTKASKDLLIFN